MSRTTKTTNISNLAKLKLKHHRRNSPIHTQNKAPQTVRPYTHSIQSPQRVCQNKAPQTSLYTLKTKHHRRYVPIHTQKRHHRRCFTIHTQSKTPQTVCHYTHLNKAPEGVPPYKHSKQSTTDGTSVYILKTKRQRRHVTIYTLKTKHRWNVPIHTQNKPPQ